jgi:hypothetical protein
MAGCPFSGLSKCCRWAHQSRESDVSGARFSAMSAWRASWSSQRRESLDEGVWMGIGASWGWGVGGTRPCLSAPGGGPKDGKGSGSFTPGGITSVTAAGGVSHPGGRAGFLDACPHPVCCDPSGGPLTLQSGAR